MDAINYITNCVCYKHVNRKYELDEIISSVWRNLDVRIASNLRPLNSSPHAQNGGHYADDIFRCSLFYEKFCILIKMSLKFVLKGLIINNPPLV